MTTYYRNRTTGNIQGHPHSGLGESFNSEEVGQDGKPIKPFVKTPITKDKIKRAKSLMKGHDTPEATTGTGSAKEQKGAL